MPAPSSISRRFVALAALALTVGLMIGAGGGSSAVPEAAIRVIAQRHVVFDWSRDACRRTNYPDLPARAFRDYLGRTQLLISHFDNFRMVGPSLDSLDVDCAPVMRSGRKRAARLYDDREWLAAVHTADGKRIWALVHDEYQGHRHRGRCPSGRYKRCWYNAITLARSDDGGRTYVQARAPRNLVAAAPYRYRPDAGTVGVLTPSNIVPGPDGALYSLVRVRNGSATRGTCLMRTARISSSRGWRAWSGDGFDRRFTDPYRTKPRHRSACRPIATDEIAEMAESLTYNTEIGRYLLVGLAGPGASSIGPKVGGVYFSTSRDLVHWSPRRLLMRATRRQAYRCGGRSPIAYPSLIDPASGSRTFATTGRTPFLYFTQLHYRDCHKTPDRDLMRIRVEVTRP